MPKNYATQSHTDLVNEATRRGLDTSGTQQELVERLTQHDTDTGQSENQNPQGGQRGGQNR